MSRKEERVNRVEASLTPQQAVLLWMQEAHRFPNMSELARSLRGQPVSAFPLSRLQRQVGEAVEAAMKGTPAPAVAQAVRRALRDLYFFYHLHLNANLRAEVEMEAWKWRRAALSERLHAMRAEDAFRTIMVMSAVRVSLEMPYPLDPETADAVEAAIRHHVFAWDQLDEDGTIATWIFDHLVKQGATEIPHGAFKYQGEKCVPTLAPHNENEVRECFKDGSQFERFRAGEDYSNGLADVTDAEFDAHYQSVVSAMRELTDSGQVQVGAVVSLKSVPILFLQEAPLVDGQWLDRHTVELAEWGALLKANGYHVAEDTEDHPLSAARFLPGDGAPADVHDSPALAKTAADDLARFQGRTTEINGRLFLHFEDYCAWPERKVEVDLSAMRREGVVASSWNAWVENHGGEGATTLAGVPVENLPCYIARHDYQICPTSADALRDRRRRLLDGLWPSQPDTDRQAEIRSDWKAAAELFLADLYSLREGLNFLGRRYFDGQKVPFPAAAEDLGKLIADTERLVDMFNSDFAKGTESAVDIDALRLSAGQLGSRLAACVVAVSKGEALRDIGEEPDSYRLMERYL